MPYSCHIRVEGLPPSPNATTRKHWTVQAKVKKEWGEKIGWLAKSKRAPRLLTKAKIHYIISVGDNRRHDPDNLAFSVAKVANDALVGIILVDDSIDNIELSFEFNRDKPRGFSIDITEAV